MPTENTQPLSGVLHKEKGEPNYHLRRYFPEPQLAGLIEQFWFVDWQLEMGKTHNQQNLPDPNFHLKVENNNVALLGPVSSMYQYTMQGNGSILGVKFNAGSLADALSLPVSQCIDKTLCPKEALNIDTEGLLTGITSAEDDKARVDVFSEFLAHLVKPRTTQIDQVQRLLALIKETPSITKVEHLVELSDVPLRAFQRSFQNYLGMSPKWLIRKYRLHHALKALEDKTLTSADLVAMLDYTDQSHLIRDFKQFLGKTP